MKTIEAMDSSVFKKFETENKELTITIPKSGHVFISWKDSVPMHYEARK